MGNNAIYKRKHDVGHFGYTEFLFPDPLSGSLLILIHAGAREAREMPPPPQEFCFTTQRLGGGGRGVLTPTPSDPDFIVRKMKFHKRKH